MLMLSHPYTTMGTFSTYGHGGTRNQKYLQCELENGTKGKTLVKQSLCTTAQTNMMSRLSSSSSTVNLPSGSIPT